MKKLEIRNSLLNVVLYDKPERGTDDHARRIAVSGNDEAEWIPLWPSPEIAQANKRFRAKTRSRCSAGEAEKTRCLLSFRPFLRSSGEWS